MNKQCRFIGSLVLYMYGQWCSAQHGQFVVLHRVASTANKTLYFTMVYVGEESSSHHVMHIPYMYCSAIYIYGI